MSHWVCLKPNFNEQQKLSSKKLTELVVIFLRISRELKMK